MTENNGTVALSAGSLADLAGRAVFIAFFGAVGASKVMGLVAELGSEKVSVLEVAAHLASLSFVLLVIWLTVARLKPHGTSEAWEPRFSALAGTLFPLLLIALPLPTAPPTARIAGLVAIACGWALSVYVLAWLGRSFSVMPQARRLVASGPYAIVRHPLYLTEEIAFLGLVLMYFTPAALAIAAVHWAFQLRRMINEEKVLLAAFPEYAAYAARTPRIIPQLTGLTARARAG